ncbi:SPRY domain-containing protein 3 isoform X2 [Plectropomus leopardus]|uniref:SPRY domain-containing protein 3 isoform X2 n=1 Tax=Plectropomus leopardus TaxID=160734 RepID=UPI001C4D47FE|nr:SPRY domain-containing protein 3 isoform X2 [Plectropomus leopardus]
MDDINVLHHRCLLNLRRRMRDIGDGRPAQERYMRLQKDGDTLSYQGNSEEVGCYVAGHPLSKGNCYFEVTIVDTGVRGTIAVGLVPKFYRLDHQPGWLPYSVAYHADNGKLYNGNPVGQQFGPKCARGDRIGCGIHSENIEAGFTTVFFTKNGKEVGSVEVPVSAEGLFPAVGMHSMGEEVKVDLQAEWLLEEDDSMMMVDSHEDDWGRLYDVRVSGTLLEYVGKGKSIMDVGLAQARQPLTTRCHYYEVEIVDAGEKCYIALGLARRRVPPNRRSDQSLWVINQAAKHPDVPPLLVEIQPTCQSARGILGLVVETRGKRSRLGGSRGFRLGGLAAFLHVSLSSSADVSLCPPLSLFPPIHLHFLFLKPQWGCQAGSLMFP